MQLADKWRILIWRNFICIHIYLYFLNCIFCTWNYFKNDEITTLIKRIAFFQQALFFFDQMFRHTIFNTLFRKLSTFSANYIYFFSDILYFRKFDNILFCILYFLYLLNNLTTFNTITTFSIIVYTLGRWGKYFLWF